MAGIPNTNETTVTLLKPQKLLRQICSRDWCRRAHKRSVLDTVWGILEP